MTEQEKIERIVRLSAEYLLKNTKIALSQLKLDDGKTISIAGEKLEVGSPVDLNNDDDTKTVLPDGSHKLDDGTSFIIKDGLVETITPKEDTTTATGTTSNTKEVTAADATTTGTTNNSTTSTDTTTTDSSSKSLDDRVKAIETMVAALMERSFQWEIDEKAPKSEQNQAVDTYINTFMSADKKEEVKTDTKTVEASEVKPGAAPAGVDTTPKAPVTTGKLTYEQAVQQKLNKK